MTIWLHVDTPTDLDWDKIRLSFKVLTIFFIVVITIVNGVIIACRVIRHGRRIFTQAATCIQISLCCGGIVQALFADIVHVYAIFEEEFDNCRAGILAITYTEHFLPFVYGWGLVFLCLDTMVRTEMAEFYTNRGFNRSLSYSVSCAVIPWLLGLEIVCPMILTDIDWDHKCLQEQSIDKEVVVQCISGILPGVCSIIAGSAVIFVYSCQQRQQQQQQQLRPNNCNVLDAETEITEPCNSTAVADITEPCNSTAVADITEPCNSTAVADITEPCNSTAVADLNTSPQSAVAGYGRNIDTIHLLPDTQIQTTSAHASSPSTSDMRFPFRNRVLLLLSCVIFSICVITNAALYLYVIRHSHVLHTEWSKLVFIVSDVQKSVHLSFNWLYDIYLVVTPLLIVFAKL